MSFVAARAGRSAGAGLLRPSSIPRSMQRISGPRSSSLHQLRPLRATGSGQAHSSTRLAGTVAALAGSGLLVGMTLLDGQTLHMDAAKKESRRSFADRMKPKEGEKAAAKEEKKGSSDKKEAPKEDAASAEKKDEKPADGEANEAKDDQDPVDFDDLSEEASQQSAFDPETNTINWDCPCLGGMADGPCGEQFKDAFSCFVFSEEEPKGVDCVDKFKAMQDCFRKYPEHYKEELEDDDEEDAGDAPSPPASEAQSKDASAEEDTDEGLREWRSEMEKENKNA